MSQRRRKMNVARGHECDLAATSSKSATILGSQRCRCDFDQSRGDIAATQMRHEISYWDAANLKRNNDLCHYFKSLVLAQTPGPFHITFQVYAIKKDLYLFLNSLSVLMFLISPGILFQSCTPSYCNLFIP